MSDQDVYLGQAAVLAFKGHQTRDICGGYSEAVPQQDKFYVSCTREPPNQSMSWSTLAAEYTALATEMLAKGRACLDIDLALLRLGVTPPQVIPPPPRVIPPPPRHDGSSSSSAVVPWEASSSAVVPYQAQQHARNIMGWNA